MCAAKVYFHSCFSCTSIRDSPLLFLPTSSSCRLLIRWTRDYIDLRDVCAKRVNSPVGTKEHLPLHPNTPPHAGHWTPLTRFRDHIGASKSLVRGSSYIHQKSSMLLDSNSHAKRGEGKSRWGWRGKDENKGSYGLDFPPYIYEPIT